MKAENLMVQSAPAAKGAGANLRSAVQAKTAAQSAKADKNDFGSALDNAKNAQKSERTETKDAPRVEVKEAPKPDASDAKQSEAENVAKTKDADVRSSETEGADAGTSDANGSDAASAVEEAAEAAKDLPKTQKKDKSGKADDAKDVKSDDAAEAEPTTREAATTLNAMLMAMAGEAQANAAQTGAGQSKVEATDGMKIQPTAAATPIEAAEPTPTFATGSLDALLPQDAAKEQQAAQNQQLMDMLSGNGAEMRLTDEQIASLSSKAQEVTANPVMAETAQSVLTEAAEIAQPQAAQQPVQSEAPVIPQTQTAEQPVQNETPVIPQTQTAQQPVQSEAPVIPQTQTAEQPVQNETPVLPQTQAAEQPVQNETPVLPQTQAAEQPVLNETPIISQAQTTEQPVRNETPVIPQTQATERPVLNETPIISQAQTTELPVRNETPVSPQATERPVLNETPMISQSTEQSVLDEAKISPQAQTAEPVIRTGEAVLEQPETTAVLQDAAGVTQARPVVQDIRTETRGEKSESLFTGVPLTVENVVLDKVQTDVRQDFGDMLNRQPQQQPQGQTNETTPEITRVSGSENLEAARTTERGEGQPSGAQPTNGAGVLPQGMSFAETLNAAGNVETAPVQQPQDPYNVMRQIVDQARLIRSDANTEMVIRLNPEHLGELTLRVVVTAGGAVSATFHTENAHVRGLLESSMVQLRQELQQQGLKVDSVDVQSGLSEDFFAQSQAGQQGYPQPQHSARNQAADRRAFENDADALTVNATVDGAAAEQAAENVGNSDGVNYLV